MKVRELRVEVGQEWSLCPFISHITDLMQTRLALQERQVQITVDRR